jgi:hypothetical protein
MFALVLESSWCNYLGLQLLQFQDQATSLPWDYTSSVASVFRTLPIRSAICCPKLRTFSSNSVFKNCDNLLSHFDSCLILFNLKVTLRTNITFVRQNLRKNFMKLCIRLLYYIRIITCKFNSLYFILFITLLTDLMKIEDVLNLLTHFIHGY